VGRGVGLGREATKPTSLTALAIGRCIGAGQILSTPIRVIEALIAGHPVPAASPRGHDQYQGNRRRSQPEERSPPEENVAALVGLQKSAQNAEDDSERIVQVVVAKLIAAGIQPDGMYSTVPAGFDITVNPEIVWQR
jgi:hypothetical protein